MIAVDTNILVYAHREETPHHDRAKVRLTELAESPAAWGIPIFCIAEFLRLITHRRLFDPPYTIDEATEAIGRVLASPSLVLLHPGDRYVPLLLAAMKEGAMSGNLVFDAQIVALCREHGVSALLTEDRDFDRFSGFRTEHL